MGIGQDTLRLADGTFSVALPGLSESLNVSVTVAICMHHARQNCLLLRGPRTTAFLSSTRREEHENALHPLRANDHVSVPKPLGDSNKSIESGPGFGERRDHLLLRGDTETTTSSDQINRGESSLEESKNRGDL